MKMGFIGLGSMGLPMVRRLLGKKLDVTVCDINPEAVSKAREAGAAVAANPRELADQVETVLVSLPTPDVVRDVALGSQGLHLGMNLKRYVDLSTTGAVVAKMVAAGLARRDVRTLDAPISGGMEGAAKGTLAIMCAGSREIFQELEPVLQILGTNVRLIGGTVGDGQSLKLINNFLVSTSVAATAEAIVMAVKAGLDPKIALDIINVSSGKNMATERYFPAAVLTRTFDFGFKIALMHKDVRLCKEEAAALGVSMPLCDALLKVWTTAVEEGFGGADMTALVQMFERRAGIEVPAALPRA